MTSKDSDEPYSTLEPVIHQLDTHKESALTGHYPPEKENTVYLPSLPTGKGAAPPPEGWPSSAATTAGARNRKICGLRRRYFWLLVGLVSVCVIVGAVVGGVLGSRSDDSPDSSPDSSSDDSKPPQQTTMAGSGSNPTRSSSLAAVYYHDDSYATEYRLYVQKEDNWVHEYTRTNADGWKHTSRVGPAVADAPIAATVVYEEVDFDLRVYFPSEANVVEEFGTRSMRENKTQWSTNPTADSLSKKNISVLEGSSLAALWLFQNKTNYYTWALFQATEGNLTLRGGDGWAIEDVPFRRPSPRSPLAMAQSWTRFNNLSSLTMFYQQEGGDIIGVWGDDKYGWTDLTVPVPAFSSDENTRLAAFVYNPGGDSPQYMILLVSNNKGVTSYVIWEGQSTWMVDSPPAMSVLDKNTPLAVTENGRAYGVSKGVVKEFRFLTDGSWEDVGDVIDL